MIANETYPTPLDTPEPGSVTTKADRTGAISEKSVWRSTEVAVYGRLETNSVDLKRRLATVGKKRSRFP